MSADAAAVSPHRLATTQNAHAAQRKLRLFSAGAVLCGVSSSAVLLVQARTSPYPLSPSLLLLVTGFLLVTVLVRLGLTRSRWYEVLEEGLRYQAPLNRVRMIPWKAMRDVRYLAGVAVPLLHRGEQPLPSSDAWLQAMGGVVAGTFLSAIVARRY